MLKTVDTWKEICLWNLTTQKFSGGGLRWQILTKERLKDPKCLEAYGYKVYSQNDEDGILQEIFRRIGTTNKTFVEFGVENGLESNGHYLLFQDWTGLWLEGSEQYVEEIRRRFRPVIRSGRLRVMNAFITRENINRLLNEARMTGEIDLLSIDIDGNDYHVWREIDAVNPRVVIIEYNGKFPPDCDWKMAYDAEHIWDGSDWHGASLKALERLGDEKGYQLVGTNLSGSNAFFVRKDLAKDLFFVPATAEALYNPMRPRMEHRSGHPARYCLKDQAEGLGVLNYVEEGKACPVFGFHALETLDGHTYCWASALKSRVAVRRAPGDTHVVIPYMMSRKALLLFKEDYRVKVSVSDEEATFAVRTETGCWRVPLPASKEDRCMIDIEVPALWSPSLIMESADNRSLGIAVNIDGVHTVCA